MFFQNTLFKDLHLCKSSINHTVLQARLSRIYNSWFFFLFFSCPVYGWSRSINTLFIWSLCLCPLAKCWNVVVRLYFLYQLINLFISWSPINPLSLSLPVLNLSPLSCHNRRSILDRFYIIYPKWPDFQSGAHVKHSVSDPPTHCH